jgi:hypothetical protein
MTARHPLSGHQQGGGREAATLTIRLSASNPRG